MRKISDEEFVTDECREYALDDVLAIRIRYGDFYFLGWIRYMNRPYKKWVGGKQCQKKILYI